MFQPKPGHQRNLEATVTFSPLFSAICLYRKRFKIILSAFLPAVLDKLALSTIEVPKKKVYENNFLFHNWYFTGWRLGINNSIFTLALRPIPKPEERVSSLLWATRFKHGGKFSLKGSFLVSPNVPCFTSTNCHFFFLQLSQPVISVVKNRTITVKNMQYYPFLSNTKTFVYTEALLPSQNSRGRSLTWLGLSHFLSFLLHWFFENKRVCKVVMSGPSQEGLAQVPLVLGRNWVYPCL